MKARRNDCRGATRRVACGLILSAAIACARPPSSGQFPAELRLPLNPLLRDAGEARRLYADDQPVAAAPAGDYLSYRFTATVEGGRTRFPRFEAMRPGLCGWSRQPLQLADPDAAVIERAGKAGKPVVIHAVWRQPDNPPPATRLFIDNRGGAAAKLEYSVQAQFVSVIAIPAGALFRAEAEMPACSGALQFSLDGRPLGAPPAPAPGAAAPWAWWLDPTGRRCYREEKIVYTKFADSFTTGGTLAAHPPGFWHPMRIQDDYILESAPQRITVSDDQIDTLGKTRWAEESCARGAG